MSSVLLLAALAWAGDAPVAPPVVLSGRVWPEEPAGVPAIAEHYPEAPAALGAHAALHRLNLDGCWRQHAALGSDLDLWFCADAKVGKRGTAAVKVTALSDPRPGLDTCIEVMLETWAGPRGVPARSLVCRAVQTNLSDVAREVWAMDPWASIRAPGRAGDASVRVSVEVGRPAIEKAVRLERDASTGDWTRVSASLSIRDRAVTTARRYLTDNQSIVAGCWRDHGQWRPPLSVGAESAGVALTLDVTVGESGPEAIQAGRVAPQTHASVAACVAARMDPGMGVSEGAWVVAVPVAVGN